MAAHRNIRSPLLVLAAAACLFPAAAGALVFSDRDGRSDLILPPPDLAAPYPGPSQEEGEAVSRLVGNAFSFLGILAVLYTLVAVPAGIVLIANGRAEKKAAAAAGFQPFPSPVGTAMTVQPPVDYRRTSTWLGLSGRVGRLWYVGVTLGSGALTGLLLVLFLASIPLSQSADGTAAVAVSVWFAVSLFLTVLLWWCRVSACVRRLHDLGASGAWYLVTFIPLLGGPVSLVMFFVLAIAEGSRADNAYGAPRAAAT